MGAKSGWRRRSRQVHELSRVLCASCQRAPRISGALHPLRRPGLLVNHWVGRQVDQVLRFAPGAAPGSAESCLRAVSGVVGPSGRGPHIFNRVILRRVGRRCFDAPLYPIRDSRMRGSRAIRGGCGAGAVLEFARERKRHERPAEAVGPSRRGGARASIEESIALVPVPGVRASNAVFRLKDQPTVRGD